MHEAGLRLGKHARMTPEQWQLARSVFDSALARPRAERRAFVDAACAADARIDASLHAEIVAMLDADEPTHCETAALGAAAGALLAQMDSDAQQRESDRWIGTRVGPWRLVRSLGHGGMGSVYLADLADGDFRQQAAIKLVRASWDAGELQRRFRGERRILASLSHPHIARLLDGGETEDAKPYLAMEYVDGQPLCRYCDERQLPIAARLRLFVSICEAVAHAHRNLIVHRDLKPSNILVDANGRVKLLDFGIARLLEDDGHATGTAARLFTPQYAAPEQVRGEAVTTSVDVYALGLMLFELLTGRRPYGQSATTPSAFERAILDEEPTRPSQAALTHDDDTRDLAHARVLEPNQLSANLRGDLDAIVLKALRKEPQQRYASVEALADDVRRYLDRRPVSARRGNWRYRAGRFLVRHRLAAAMVTLAFAALLAGLSVALWQARIAREQQAVAQSEADKARAVTQFIVGVFKSADPTSNDGSNPRATELLGHALDDIKAQTDLAPGTRAAIQIAMGSAYLSMDDHAHGIVLMRDARNAGLTTDDANLQVESGIELARALDIGGQTTPALEELKRIQPLLAQHTTIEPRLRHRFDYVMATMLHNLDRSGEALLYSERVYRESLASDGPGSAEVGHVLEVYAAILDSLHRNDEAIAITRMNYEASKASKDMPLVRRINLTNAYAYALLTADHAVEAEQPYRESLALEEQLYGKGSLSTDTSLANISVTLRNQGRYVEAAEFAERVLAVRRAHLEPDSAGIARALCSLGETWRRAGDIDKGIALMREGLAIYDKQGESEKSFALGARVNLALALETSGRYDEALTELAHVLPHTKQNGSRYAGAGGAPVLLLQARLLAQRSPSLEDCSAALAVLDVAAKDSVHADEARVLAADCEMRANADDQAHAHLLALAKPEDTKRLSAFAQTRLTALREQPQ
jgi:serine/threonine-protein kinase